jgi:hypothetical protein
MKMFSNDKFALFKKRHEEVLSSPNCSIAWTNDVDLRLECCIIGQYHVDLILSIL